MPPTTDVLQGALDLLILKIEAEWGVSPEGRRAKFYELTKAGRAQLVEERERWNLFSTAMRAVLATP